MNLTEKDLHHRVKKLEEENKKLKQSLLSNKDDIAALSEEYQASVEELRQQNDVNERLNESYRKTNQELLHKNNEIKQLYGILEHSEHKFRSLFDVLVDPMYIIDFEGNFLEVNSSACNQLGYSKEKLLMLKVADIDIAFSREKVLAMIERVKKDKIIQFEGVHKTADGKIIQVEIHSKLIDFLGSPAILNLTRDISGRKQAENRYEFLSSATMEGILVHKNGIAIDMNPTLSKITGYQREELIGMNVFGLVENDKDREKAKNNVLKDYKFPYEIKARRKNGSVFAAEIIGRKMQYNDEEVRIIIIRDITEQKRKESEIKRLYKFTQTLLNTLPTPVFSKDAQGKYLGCNRAFEELTGKSEQEITGKTVFELWPGEQAEIYHLKDMELISNPGLQSYEFAVTDKNNITREVIFHKTVFYDENDKPAGILGVYFDISDRKIQERLLQKRLKYEQALAKCSNDLLKDTGRSVSKALAYILDASGAARIYIYENYEDENTDLRMKKIHEKKKSINTNDGYFSPGDFSYKNDGYLHWIDLLVKEKYLFENLSDLHETGRGIIESDDANSLLVIPLKVKQKWFGFVGFEFPYQKEDFFSDDMVILQVFAKMLGYYFQSKKHDEMLRARNEELQKLNSTKDKLFSIIGHDLKNPLNNVVCFAELLGEKYKDAPREKIGQYQKAIHDSAKSISDLLETLLQWSRALKGNNLSKPDNLQLHYTVDNIIKWFAIQVEQKSLKLENHVLEAFTLQADEDHISTILRNLISNSIKFTKAGGVIKVAAEHEQDAVLVSVSDNGIGMKKETAEILFTQNGILSSTGTDGEKGTGLGLMICKELVEQAGGSIWVQSRKNRGSTFYFKIPQERNI
ncbi:MAG: PAS domain S-box protein [Bacteroidales bacterium]